MNSSKLVLVAIAIVAVGLFGLPSSVSLFSGQHTWYDLGESAGSDVPCEKCHADINDEMIDADNGIHEALAGPGCNCHRIPSEVPNVAIGGYGGKSPEPGTTAHAAETIACMFCHEDGTVFPFAGGFSQEAVEAAAGGSTTPYTYSSGGIGGEHAAHNQFIGQAIENTLMEDSNEACIACHTRVGVDIQWTKNVGMNFQARENDLGLWTVSDFTATGHDLTNVSYPNEWVT